MSDIYFIVSCRGFGGGLFIASWTCVVVSVIVVCVFMCLFVLVNYLFNAFAICVDEVTVFSLKVIV